MIAQIGDLHSAAIQNSGLKFDKKRLKEKNSNKNVTFMNYKCL